MTTDASDSRITVAVDGITQAIRRFLLKRVHATEDGDRDAAQEEVAEAIRRAVASLEDDGRKTVVGTLESLIGPIIDVIPSGEDQAVGEAEGIVRDANIARLHKQFDTGRRHLIWPPSPDVEWDELRVMVAQFMERRQSDWPEIAFAEKPIMGSPYSPFDSAVQGAQFFLGFWLAAETREDLLKTLDEDHIAAWERYLELPPKP